MTDTFYSALQLSILSCILWKLCFPLYCKFIIIRVRPFVNAFLYYFSKFFITLFLRYNCQNIPSIIYSQTSVISVPKACCQSLYDFNPLEILYQDTRAVLNAELGSVKDHMVVVHISPDLSGMFIVIFAACLIVLLQHGRIFNTCK